jgi:hypothetical protein
MAADVLLAIEYYGKVDDPQFADDDDVGFFFRATVSVMVFHVLAQISLDWMTSMQFVSSADRKYPMFWRKVLLNVLHVRIVYESYK